jgi:hypothetical protein
MKLLTTGLIALALAGSISAAARADTEWSGTGDMRDFRFKGESIGLTANIRMTSPDGSQTGMASLTTARTGTRVAFTGNIGFGGAAGGRGGGGGAPGGRGGGGGVPAGGASLRVQTDDTAPDTTTFDVQATAAAAIPLEGMYYSFNLSGANFSAGSAEAVLADGTAPSKVSLASPPQGSSKYLDVTARSIRLTGNANRTIEFTFPNSTHVIVQQAPASGGRGAGGGGRGGSAPSISLLIPIGTGTLNPDTPFHAAFTLKATCDLDTTPVKLTLDPSKTGPAFVGIGGNFRLQSAVDPAHIAYNLENLRVAWGRVEMPLSSWQSTETADPTAAPLPNNVRQAMEMAQTLAKKNIPFIISDWSAPGWATVAGGGRGGGGGGGGNIAPEKWPAMYKGITSYIVYLKKNYDAEPAYFSFNEADQGINVRLSPDDHATTIKGLGAAFAQAGLATKLLLGDTGNPQSRPANFIDVAVADPEAMKYVGAVSYHCWTGGSDQIIAKWGQIAQQFKLPCLVGEGGTDPNSYRYASLFLEPWYSLDEINLYLRCMALSQAASILHWQLTENMGVLTGGRNGAPLQPTQRFYNLKQLNLSPPEAPWLAIASDRPRITTAAYGDPAHGYAIHVINTGSTRTVTLTGLPVALTQLYPNVTDATRGMKALDPVPVSGGTATFTLDCQSFVTLTSAKP